jgi:predicted Zn-dependent peptidase
MGVYFPRTPAMEKLNVADYLQIETENRKNVVRSQLPNGMTLISNDSLDKGNSFVSLYVHAGSRFQDYDNEGVTHFVERFLYAPTNQRSFLRLVSDMQKTGANISAQAGREYIVYQSESLREAVPQTWELISNSILQGRLLEWDLPPKRDLVRQDIELYGADPEFILGELLHQTAYNRSGLGRSLICPAHRLNTITASDVIDYMDLLFTPDRMTLVATNFVHEDLELLANKLFGHLEPLDHSIEQSSDYVGGKNAIAAVLDAPEDAKTHSILAFNGASLQNLVSYYACNVLSQLLGAGSNFYIPSLAKRGSLLQREIMDKKEGIRHARAFSISYNDNGLFGIYLQGKNGEIVEDAQAEIFDLLPNVAKHITKEQLEAAKKATLLQFLSSLETSCGLNEFNAKFGNQDEHVKVIKGIQIKDIMNAVQTVTNERATLVTVGNLE